MFLRALSALLLAATVVPGLARADEVLEQGLSTLWEVLWHQSGTPTRVVRWEGEIRVRLSGVNLPQHRETVMRALSDVTQEAGVRLVDVTDQPHQNANLQVEITPDTALEDRQPCATTLQFRRETRIDSAVVRMRERDTWRCAHHEAMHVMGVRGHPAGATVLSYFPISVDGLLPLDRVMLRGWYSPRMVGGMTPFEALAVLSDELVSAHADPGAATGVRNRFLATTLQQMQGFATGQGDIPSVVKRSGKSTEEGIRLGRSEMSYFLGVAYLQGIAGAAPDRGQAQRWLEQAASSGHRPAQARLGGFR